MFLIQVPGLGTGGVVVSGSGERPSELGDLSGGLVDGDHVAGLNLLLDHGFDHFGALANKEWSALWN